MKEFLSSPLFLCWLYINLTIIFFYLGYYLDHYFDTGGKISAFWKKIKVKAAVFTGRILKYFILLLFDLRIIYIRLKLLFKK